MLPAISTYYAKPYGQSAYHLTAVLGNIANPVACTCALFLKTTNFFYLMSLFLVSLVLSGYMLYCAIMSPCPPLVKDGALGVAIIVIVQVLFTGATSYIKVVVGLIFRDYSFISSRNINTNTNTNTNGTGESESSLLKEENEINENDCNNISDGGGDDDDNDVNNNNNKNNKNNKNKNNTFTNQTNHQLVAYGIATQLGSLIGAVLFYFLCNHATIFKPSYDCVDMCTIKEI